MPLRWTIDPHQRMLTAVAEGDVTRAEFETYLDTLDAAGAHGYRKLFDGGRGSTRMPSEDILALGVRMRAAHATGPIGALAVVVPDDFADAVGRVLGMLAAADRPMRVFGTLGPARKWLKRVPAPESA